MATRRIAVPFAENGDRTPIDDTTANDLVSYDTGYTPAYQIPQGDPGYRNIDRAQENAFKHDVSSNIKAWQEQVYPDFFTGISYPFGAVVKFKNSYYQAIAIGGTSAVITDPSLSGEWALFDGLSEVSPLNNTWNGYLDPEHQSSLPAPNGYPGNSGGGEVVYAADEEISYGIYAGVSGSTVSSDSDGWVFTDSIYRECRYATEQLVNIDVNTVSIYMKGQDGSEHFVTNATNGVTVTKPDAETLRVEITDAIFATLGITKLWRWFDTERVGRVVELDPQGLIDKLRSELMRKRKYVDVYGSRTPGVAYPNNTGVDIKLDIYVPGPGTRNLTITYPDSTVVVITKTNDSMQFFETIPDGATYSIDAAVNIWFELRLP